MKSAGGLVMPPFSTDLQYMVREPNCPHAKQESLMNGFIKERKMLQIYWRSRQGTVYVDGSHLCHPIKFGSTIELTSSAPPLKIFMGSLKN